MCWGDEPSGFSYGQSLPPGGSFRSVAVSAVFSCGLRTDGEVECWGLREDPERRLVGWNNDRGLWPQGPFTALSTGNDNYGICALRVGGEMVCWNDGSATHRPPPGVFVALDAGPTATCGLRPSGKVECWGFERPADRGPDFREVYPLEWDVPAGRFTAVSVGDGYACALRPDGEAACWGRGKAREARHTGEAISEREIRRRLLPPPGPFVALSAFDEFTCVLRADGDVACWGMDDSWSERELDDPPTGPFTAVQAGDGRVCALRASGNATCWLTDSGSRTDSGDETAMPSGVFAALVSGEATLCGLRPGGELACGDADSDLTRNAPDASFRSVATNTRPRGHSCGLDYDGNITCWSHLSDWNEPAPPGPFTAVTVASAHSCGLRPNGTAECWTHHWPPGADPAAGWMGATAGAT